MKRLIFIAAAVLVALTACTKSELASSGDNEISFQTASYATKAGITGTVFPKTETFGAYAWADGTVGEYFMNNEEVSYNASTNKWKPASTYYWPKNNTVDFICYYPYGMSEISITQTGISYKNFDVASNQIDVMYADKAAGYCDNVDEVEDDATSGYNGVPAFFHHALAKVSVIVSLAYNHKEEADGTITDWTVSLNGISLNGFYKAGDCNLALASSPTTGIISWEKPVDAEGYHVWTNDGTVTDQAGTVPSGNLATGNEYEVISEFFVLPQTLVNGVQTVTVDLTVKTKRNGADFLSETFSKTANLYLDTLPAWQINQKTVYNLVISPTASAGDGGDPSNPVDPNDPDLSDAVISFDPAVDGWDNVGVVTTIKL